MGLVGLGDDVDRARLQRAHDVGGQAGRRHQHAVGVAGHDHLDVDRELVVGTGHGQLVALQLQTQVAEQRIVAGGGRPSGDAEGFGEHVTFASEPHVGSFSSLDG